MEYHQTMTVHSEGIVTFGEAAAVLGVSTPVIRGLVAQGILHITAEYRNGFSKLLPAADVQRFAEGYVATSVLAKRFHLDSGSLARYLKESGTQLLAWHRAILPQILRPEQIPGDPTKPVSV